MGQEEIIRFFINYVIPVIVGAFIGYITNFIAIKMLFHPRKKIYIAKIPLAFTPGVLPKNKSRIAKAISNAVSEKLFTNSDIVSVIADEKMISDVANNLSNSLLSEERCISSLIEKENCENLKNTITSYLTGEVVNEVLKSNLNPSIKHILNNSLSEYLSNPLLAMFINDSMIDKISNVVEEGIKAYISKDGQVFISDIIYKKISEFLDKPVKNIANDLSLNDEIIYSILKTALSGVVQRIGGIISSKSSAIANIVEDKINKMDVIELEKLVLSVMKRELSSIVNLGCLIGALIAILGLIFR